jgi:outer membrane protein OmpA-like peptidoglycan-associated protein
VFEEEDKETGYAVFLAITLAIVVSLSMIAVAVGSMIGQAGGKPASAAAPSMVRVISQVYFEPGKAEPPPDVLMLLRPAIRAAMAMEGSKLVISGYHDGSGDAAANAELARRRAMTVREVLTAAGISEQRIELARHVVAVGSTDPNEARRVDVTLR